jgi:hypothetical protein
MGLRRAFRRTRGCVLVVLAVVVVVGKWGLSEAMQRWRVLRPLCRRRSRGCSD